MSEKTVQKEKQILNHDEFHKMVRDHQKWLKNPQTGARAVFKDVIMIHLSLRGGILTRAIFDNVVLDHVEFYKVGFHNTKFVNVVSMSLIFSECHLIDAVFTDVDFNLAHLTGTSCDKSVFTNVNFSNAFFGGAASLQNTRCLNVNFSKAKLVATSMNGIYIKNSVLDGADLRYSYLGGSEIVFSYLRDCKIQGAHVQGTRIRYCNLSGTLSARDTEITKRCVFNDADADVLLLSPVSLITKLGRFSISVLRSLLMVCVCLIDLVFPVTFTYLIGKSMLKLVWFILALPSMVCDLFRRERDSTYMRDYPVYKEKY
jgi:uncharacterized protein YjbI with pentapeptide repeats